MFICVLVGELEVDEEFKLAGIWYSSLKYGKEASEMVATWAAGQHQEEVVESVTEQCQKKKGILMEARWF